MIEFGTNRDTWNEKFSFCFKYIAINTTIYCTSIYFAIRKVFKSFNTRNQRNHFIIRLRWLFTLYLVIWRFHQYDDEINEMWRSVRRLVRESVYERFDGRSNWKEGSEERDVKYKGTLVINKRRWIFHEHAIVLKRVKAFHPWKLEIRRNFRERAHFYDTFLLALSLKSEGERVSRFYLTEGREVISPVSPSIVIWLIISVVSRGIVLT